MIKERKDPFQNNRCLETIFRDNNNLYTRLFNVSYSSTVRIVSVSTDVAAKTLKRYAIIWFKNFALLILMLLLEKILQLT